MLLLNRFLLPVNKAGNQASVLHLEFNFFFNKDIEHDRIE